MDYGNMVDYFYVDMVGYGNMVNYGDMVWI